MLEVTESDDEIELSLALSIGGSYKKLEKSLVEEEEEKKAIHLPRSGLSFPPPLTTSTIVGDKVETESGSGSEVVVEVEDYYSQRNKKEIQALRRQEARRKREVKLRKSASSSNSNNVVGVANADDKMLLETQQLQSRVRDREMRENDALVEDRKKHNFAKCVGNEKNGSSNTIIKDSNFIFASRNNGGVTYGNRDHQGSGTKPPPPPPPPAAAAVSFLQNNVPYYPQFLQCATQKNGFVHPHHNHNHNHNHMVESCLGHNLGKDENGSTKGKNVISQPVNFRPYPNGNGNGNLKRYSGTGTRGDSEQNSGKCGSEIQEVMSSNGSPERTSSAVSDYRSTSGKGGGSSSESGGSHSSSIGANEQQFGVSPINNNNRRMVMMSSSQPETIVSSSSSEMKDIGRQGGDRRRSAEAQRSKPSLPRMPCVSTTGNGPNGKTVTGFLYRYTKTEVSIVCVCHGTSFSPAEFVEHAGGGGTDVTNPLRHITMVPSPFGD